MEAKIAELDDRQVLLVLGYLTAELPEVPEIGSEDEARAAIAAFVEQFGQERVEPERVGRDDPAAARALLETLLEDPATGPAARKLVAAPPTGNEQLSVVDVAPDVAIMLGVVITWLRTKFDLEVKHEDGKTSYRFSAGMEPVAPEVIAEAVRKTLLR